MPARSYVDFNHVDPRHADIHDRLLNWARWCVGGGGSGMHPMFHGFQANEHWVPKETVVPVDSLDASRMETAVMRMPQAHSAALRWSYVYGTSPRKMAQALGCTLESLQNLVVSGRQILVNRGY